MSTLNLSTLKAKAKDRLLEIAKKYKTIEATKESGLREILHHKNSDANLHIKLLETAAEQIKTAIDPKVKIPTQLGVLLVLKALLTDPNREGEVYTDLVESLGLEEALRKLFKKQGLAMDPTDMNYLQETKSAIELARSMMDTPAFKEKFDSSFIKDLFTTIDAELDYTDRLMQSLDPWRSKMMKAFP